MIRFLLTLGCLLSIAPAVASAGLDLRIGPNRGPAEVDAVVAPGSGEHFFDLTFTDSPPSQNESLYAYDVAFITDRPGLTLVRAERPDHWVLTAPDATFTQFEARPDFVVAGGTDGFSIGSDITTGTKAARLAFRVDPGTAPGLYRINLDPSFTAWSSGDPFGPNLFPYVDITDPGLVLVTPDPSGLGLLSVGTLLALRRRGGPRALE
jgi:hypothetical protein